MDGGHAPRVALPPSVSISSGVLRVLPSRFVRAHVEELRRADPKLASLPSQRVVDRYGESILTSFRLELSLAPPERSEPLDPEERARLRKEAKLQKKAAKKAKKKR